MRMISRVNLQHTGKGAICLQLGMRIINRFRVACQRATWLRVASCHRKRAAKLAAEGSRLAQRHPDYHHFTPRTLGPLRERGVHAAVVCYSDRVSSSEIAGCVCGANLTR